MFRFQRYFKLATLALTLACTACGSHSSGTFGGLPGSGEAPKSVEQTDIEKASNAVTEDRLDALTALVEGGFDVNTPLARGQTALHLAASLNRLAIVAYLISAGADPTLADDDGKTAKDLAAGFPDIVAILAPDEQKPLQDEFMAAIVAMNSALVVELLNKNYPPNFVHEATGETPLTYVLKQLPQPAAQELLGKILRGSIATLFDVNLKNAAGESPLKLATGHGRIAARLIELGAKEN